MVPSAGFACGEVAVESRRLRSDRPARSAGRGTSEASALGGIRTRTAWPLKPETLPVGTYEGGDDIARRNRALGRIRTGTAWYLKPETLPVGAYEGRWGDPRESNPDLKFHRLLCEPLHQDHHAAGPQGIKPCVPSFGGKDSHADEAYDAPSLARGATGRIRTFASRVRSPVSHPWNGGGSAGPGDRTQRVRYVRPSSPPGELSGKETAPHPTRPSGRLPWCGPCHVPRGGVEPPPSAYRAGALPVELSGPGIAAGTRTRIFGVRDQCTGLLCYSDVITSEIGRNRTCAHPLNKRPLYC